MNTQYTTDGVSTVFTIHFPFFDDADVNAIFVDSAGSATTLTLSTDFSVTGGNGSGGTLITTAALTTGGTLTIFRDIAYTQEDDYVENDPLPAATLEGGFDRAAMRDQQLKDAVDRAMRFPPTIDPDVSAELPAPSGDLVLGWNGAGTALENKSLPTGTAVYSSTGNTNLGTSTAEAVTPKGLHDSVYNPNGKHLIPIDGASIVPAATAGATVVSTEDATNKHNRRGLSFSNSVQQFGCFDLSWPKSSNEGTITFKYECDSTGSGNVEFALEAVGIGDGDTLDTAYGSAVSVIKAIASAGKKYISDESLAITISGLTEGDTVQFRVKRIITTSGNVAAAVVLRKLRVFMTTDAGTDA